MPRCSTSRATATSGSTSTTTSAAMSSRPGLHEQRDVEHHEVVGVDLRREPPGDLHAHRRVDDQSEVLEGIGIVEDEVGHRGAVEGAVGRDDARTEALHHGGEHARCPARCSSRVIASASMITAPLAASSVETVDLPEPMPPVRPMRSTARTLLPG